MRGTVAFMKQILFIVSMYACLPCYAMEEQSIVSQDARQESASLLVHQNELPLSPNATFQTEKQQRLLAGRPVTCKRCVMGCKKTASLWAVPVPLALAGGLIGVISHTQTLRYVALGCEAASALWAGCWLIAHYKAMTRHQREFAEQYEAAGNHAHALQLEEVAEIEDQGSLSQVETESLL